MGDEVEQGWDGTIETVAFKAEAVELGEGGEVENGVGEVEVFKDEAGNMVVVVVVESKYYTIKFLSQILSFVFHKDEDMIRPKRKTI